MFSIRRVGINQTQGLLTSKYCLPHGGLLLPTPSPTHTLYHTSFPASCLAYFSPTHSVLLLYICSSLLHLLLPPTLCPFSRVFSPPALPHLFTSLCTHTWALPVWRYSRALATSQATCSRACEGRETGEGRWVSREPLDMKG